MRVECSLFSFSESSNQEGDTRPRSSGHGNTGARIEGWVKAIILKSFLSQYGVSFRVREKGLNRGFRCRSPCDYLACNGRRVTGNNAVESGDGVTRVYSQRRGLFR